MVNAVYNRGSHIQFLDFLNSKNKGGYDILSVFIHILGHFPSCLILWSCLIIVKFINDPCDLVFYLISVFSCFCGGAE